VSESPIFWTKIHAARDRGISAEAFRLLALLVDTRADVRKFPEHEFTLPWREVSNWTGWSRRTAYRHLSELVDAGYLIKRGLRGCPAKAAFSFSASGAKNGHTGGAKNGHSSGARKGSRHTSNSVPEGKGTKRKEEMAGSARRKEGDGTEPQAAEDQPKRHVSELMRWAVENGL
jgi:hypothetical protein